jgi:hypothetical protein
MMRAGHERLGPGPVPDLGVKLEANPRGSGLPKTLFGAATVPRDYRVQARAVTGNSYSPIGLDLLLHGGRTYRFAIEQWPPDRTESKVEYVLFRFWPPADIDGVNVWSCPCGRPVADVDERAPGHWEWRVPIDYKRRRVVVAG